MEDERVNPNSNQIDLGVLSAAMEPSPSKLSWASVVQGTPLQTQQSMEVVQVES